MNTTEELFETTEGQAVASVTTDANVQPDQDVGIEIPENYFDDVKDEEFVGEDFEDNTDMFQMDFSEAAEFDE